MQTVEINSQVSSKSNQINYENPPQSNCQNSTANFTTRPGLPHHTVNFAIRFHIIALHMKVQSDHLTSFRSYKDGIFVQTSRKDVIVIYAAVWRPTNVSSSRIMKELCSFHKLINGHFFVH